MNVLVIFAALILLAFFLVKPVHEGAAACRSVMGRVLAREVAPGFRLRVPYFWDIQAYPSCWFTSSTMDLTANQATASGSALVSCTVRWWIADAYVFSQVKARAVAHALDTNRQPRIVGSKGRSPELNSLLSIGHSAIAELLGEWLQQPDALKRSVILPPKVALRGGSGSAYEGTNGALIQILNPLLLQHCGVIIDRLNLERDE